MSKEIVKIFNGDICFISKVGNGSCFTFSFELESNSNWNDE
jgi:hypothetical protein